MRHLFRLWNPIRREVSFYPYWFLDSLSSTLSLFLSSVPSGDSCKYHSCQEWPDPTARSHRSLSHNHKGNTTPGSIHHSKPPLSFLCGLMVCCHTLHLKQMERRPAAMHVRLQSPCFLIHSDGLTKTTMGKIDGGKSSNRNGLCGFEADFTCSTFLGLFWINNRLYKLLMWDFKGLTLFNLNANRL